jgi:hypothetical protein
MDTIENNPSISALRPGGELPPLDEVEGDVFIWEANEILRCLRAYGNGNISRQDAITRTRERFVNNAEFAELANLADVLVSAPEANETNKRLNGIKDKLFRLNQENPVVNDPKLKKEIDELKRLRKLEIAKILPWNHKLRELIDTVAGHVDRSTVINWIENATNNRVEAERTVAGIGAEVAVARLARSVFGSERVRLSTQAEDARGIDMIITADDGREINIDIKTGGNINDVDPRTVEFAIARDDIGINEFDVREDKRDELARRIREAIA